jgi:hypothetical protein
MRRHEVDLFSLVTGLVFTVVACIYLTAAASDRNVGGDWVLPVVLVTVGVASLAGLLRGRSPDAPAASYDGPDGARAESSADASADTDDTLVLSREEAEER